MTESHFNVTHEGDTIIIHQRYHDQLADDYVNYLTKNGYYTYDFKAHIICGVNRILKKSNEIKNNTTHNDEKSKQEALATELNLCKEELKFLQTEYAQLLNDFEDKCYTLDVIEGIITERNK